MKFIDVVEIKVKAGDGGPGMAHFRREKYVPEGGPDGGDGGNGGSLYVESTTRLSTLLDFRYQRRYQAQGGEAGGTNNCTGKSGEDKILHVPCGTVVYDANTKVCLGEVLQEGDRLLVAQGGRGGLGNAKFVSSRQQAPLRTVAPSPGEDRSLRLELKLIADVGIIGAPNAGKSTLVTVISKATPKVADYPFTTLVPTLGVVRYKDEAPFVVADVPGLIAGASLGKGLGHEFLRHIERTRVLVHLIDGSQEKWEDMVSDYESILEELRRYDSTLLDRPRLTVISKLDFLSSSQAKSEGGQQMTDPLTSLVHFRHYLTQRQVPYLEISAATRLGINLILRSIQKLLTGDEEIAVT